MVLTKYAVRAMMTGGGRRRLCRRLIVPVLHAPLPHGIRLRAEEAPDRLYCRFWS
jgi:hypothetical protein